MITGTHPEYYSDRDVGCGAGLSRSRRPADVSRRQRLLLAHRLPSRASRRHRASARRGRGARLVRGARRILHVLHRRIWRALAAQRPSAAGPTRVGFVAQGFDVSSYYVRKPDSFDPRAAFIFEGVGPRRRSAISASSAAGRQGSSSTATTSCSGRRRDPAPRLTRRGTPTSTARRGGDHLQLPDDWVARMNSGVHGRHRLLHDPGGGGVFSSSSIAWCGSPARADYDNAVSRVTANVLRPFVKDEPLPALGETGSG